MLLLSCLISNVMSCKLCSKLNLLVDNVSLSSVILQSAALAHPVLSRLLPANASVAVPVYPVLLSSISSARLPSV